MCQYDWCWICGQKFTPYHFFIGRCAGLTNAQRPAFLNRIGNNCCMYSIYLIILLIIPVVICLLVIAAALLLIIGLLGLGPLFLVGVLSKNKRFLTHHASLPRGFKVLEFTLIILLGFLLDPIAIAVVLLIATGLLLYVLLNCCADCLRFCFCLP